MLGNFRNKDTMQIFNEMWKTKENVKRNSDDMRKKFFSNMTPSEQAKRIATNINNYSENQKNKFMDKFKYKS